MTKSASLHDAIHARLKAERDERADRERERVLAFQPDPELERQIAVREQARAGGQQPHLPAEHAARLAGYLKRKAAAAALADTPTPEGDAA